ncbi:cyclic nucleotide-binding domain protein [Dictyocaulus viviparus]|uniref:Cyclic nucleotide-binding domain protein n=1 Tax=Dictyocaulus viviparus TaxID=29172 RepID=A0A0D8XCA7_DICVI|nr:cyclic nucleotide-binding domain protein [Dictyocaulus viviparus]
MRLGINKICLGICDRCTAYFITKLTQYAMAHRDELLYVLPPRLQGQIAVNLHMDTMKKVELFKLCSAGFLYEVVLRIKQHIYGPNDYLFRTGDRAKRKMRGQFACAIISEMFIVKRGTLHVIGEESSTLIMTLTDGATIGEMSVIPITGNQLGDRRTVSLKSVGYSDVYILNQDDVSAILQDYPNDRDTLICNAREMLCSRNLLSETAVELHDEPLSLLSLEEQLNRLKSQINELDEQVNNTCASFHHFSNDMKRRVTVMERIFAKHRNRIKFDCIRGKILL